MSTLTENPRPGGFLASQAHGTRAIDKLTIAANQVLKAGAVLGQVTTGSSAAAAADAGNTGDGAMGAITVSAGAKPGDYRLHIIAAATDAGTFMLTDPDGLTVGIGTVAVAFSAGGLAFTLADGAADFVAGDAITITVAAGSGEYVAHDPANTDGSGNAVAVLFAGIDTTGAAAKAAVVVRDAEVTAAELVWFAGATDQQKAAGQAALAARGIIAR